MVAGSESTDTNAGLPAQALRTCVTEPRCILTCNALWLIQPARSSYVAQYVPLYSSICLLISLAERQGNTPCLAPWSLHGAECVRLVPCYLHSTIFIEPFSPPATHSAFTCHFRLFQISFNCLLTAVAHPSPSLLRGPRKISDFWGALGGGGSGGATFRFFFDGLVCAKPKAKHSAAIERYCRHQTPPTAAHLMPHRTHIRHQRATTHPKHRSNYPPCYSNPFVVYCLHILAYLNYFYYLCHRFNAILP